VTLYVVDASVAIKWYVPEVHSETAACLLDGTHKIIAPDLLLPEFGNILWKKVQRGQISVETSRTILQEFKAVALQIYPSEPLLETAVDMAMPAAGCAYALGQTVYDCFYLVLAVTQQCQMVTADGKFYNALKTSSYASNLLWVENI
jgi:predicted nucleic acid-binding protein